MDTIKIGRFIAELRKEKGLTQKELGECLDVSDKTVSKWERGINLPDPSLYFPLCEILGISVNELFAGERIEKDKMIEKSEENIINIMNEQRKKQKRLESIGKVVKIIALCLVPLIVLQWKLKLVWLELGFEGLGGVLGVFTPNKQVYMCMILYMLSYLYFVAYFLVFKKIKFGYYMMWIIYIVLAFTYLILVGINSKWLLVSTSIDLWINVILVIIGTTNKEINPSHLLKRGS